MNKKVDNEILAMQDSMVESICQSVRFKSVEGIPSAGAPFGKDVADALNHALNTASALGLSAENMDGYVGCIEYGEGEDLLGVVCHMDVVPEGTGWIHPAFGGEIHDDRIYGRGTLDDKGPAISSVYALAAIKKAGIRLKKRVRIILGTNEETGWGGMNYYKQHGEIPTLAFSPDADYPVVNSEKGILHTTFRCDFASGIRLDAGTRPNVVPGRTDAFVPCDAEDVSAACAVLTENGFEYELALEDGGTRITVHGLDAHGSMPEDGKNSLLATLAMMTALPLSGDDAQMVRALHSIFKFNLHGEEFGLCREDESGILTMNPGVMHWNSDGISEFSIDVRYPKSMTGDEVKSAQIALLEPLGFELLKEHNQLPHYIPADSELVQKLLKVYEMRSGEYLPPMAIGGGTYARAFPNAVAFGCERAGISASVHMPNEYISIEDVMFNTFMIADAILALAE